MGSIESRIDAAKSSVKENVVGFQAQQREIQMAINISQARDMVQYMSGVWVGIATLVALKTAGSGSFPAPAAVPLAVLPIVIGYQADMAYGSKLRRVVLEAEHILENERERFIPPKQAPFSHLYDKERTTLASSKWASVGRVSSYWPSMVQKQLGEQVE